MMYRMSSGFCPCAGTALSGYREASTPRLAMLDEFDFSRSDLLVSTSFANINFLSVSHCASFPAVCMTSAVPAGVLLMTVPRPPSLQATEAIRCSRSVCTSTASASHWRNRCLRRHAAPSHVPPLEKAATSNGATSFLAATGSSPPSRDATVAIRDADCSTLLWGSARKVTLYPRAARPRAATANALAVPDHSRAECRKRIRTYTADEIIGSFLVVLPNCKV